MILFLLLLASLLIAWSVREQSLVFLERFSHYHHSLRLKGFMEPSRGLVRYRAFFYALEDNLQVLLRKDLFKKYLGYLKTQIGRVGLSHLKPFHVVGYQVIAAFGAGVFFAFLSEELLLSLAGFGIGALLPVLWLRDRALERERRVLRELPNLMEVLSLCSEAGLSMEQGMEQYAASSKAGPLSEEVRRILTQTQTGSSRKDALSTAAGRLGLTDFSLFTTSVIQAERFGTGIAKTLRQLSMSLRDKQTQRAEKAVQEMPVKMLLPLVFCIMPVTFLIIFGPVLLRFFNP